MGLAVFQRPVYAENSHRANPFRTILEMIAAATLPAVSWQDSLGDGFPDGARLEGARDRGNLPTGLRSWRKRSITRPHPNARDEVQDCAALVRYRLPEFADGAFAGMA